MRGVRGPEPCFDTVPDASITFESKFRWRLIPKAMSDVTRILDAIEHGDAKAADELHPLLYEELRKLPAHRRALDQ